MVVTSTTDIGQSSAKCTHRHTHTNEQLPLYLCQWRRKNEWHGKKKSLHWNHHNNWCYPVIRWEWKQIWKTCSCRESRVWMDRIWKCQWWFHEISFFICLCIAFDEQKNAQRKKRNLNLFNCFTARTHADRHTAMATSNKIMTRTSKNVNAKCRNENKTYFPLKS